MKSSVIQGTASEVRFDDLLQLRVEASGEVFASVHRSTNNQFSQDPEIGRAAFNINSLADGNVWMELSSGHGQDAQVAGKLHLDVQLPRKHKKGMTFRAAKSILSNSSSDDLAALSISDGAAASKVKKTIKEVLVSGSQELDLSGFSLESLPAELADVSKKVTNLDLSFNLFTTYPDVSFLGFQYLEELTLTGNGMTVLPGTIASLGNLTALSVNGNKLSELPPEIGELMLLERLNVSNNLLAALVPQVGLLTNLQDLIIGGNPLRELPRSIGRCESLEVMDASCCELEQLPMEFSGMTRLIELDLGKNQLIALPSNIGRMTRLVTLNLCDNHLRDLPMSMGYNVSLRQCFIDRNPIKDQVLVEKARVGTDHLVHYLETRMLDYLHAKGINPSKIDINKNSPAQQRRKQQEQRSSSLAASTAAAEEEAAATEQKAEVERKRAAMASLTPKEHAIHEKLQKAKLMGISLIDDTLLRIKNLEIFISNVTTTKAGLPFARMVNAVKLDVEALQMIVGAQRMPHVARAPLGLGSPQLQNFKHSLFLQLAMTRVTLEASKAFLSTAEDATHIVGIVKGVRTLSFKLTPQM